MEEYIVSARKYRPMTFDSVVGQAALTTTLKNAVKSGKLAHAYLFCGPRGVGKTTTARIFAKAINCSNPSPQMDPCGKCESCLSFSEGRSYCIHELDAASNNGVDDIRNLMESRFRFRLRWGSTASTSSMRYTCFLRLPSMLSSRLSRNRRHMPYSSLQPQRRTRFSRPSFPVARFTTSSA